MTKKMIISTVSTVLLLVGCGGGGGSSTPVDPMTEKNAIIIFYHYPADVCLGDTLRNELITSTPGASDFLLRVEDNSVSCATYGKINDVTDTEGCMTIDMAFYDTSFLQYDTSCVVGFQVTDTSNLSTVQISEDVSIAATLSVDDFN